MKPGLKALLLDHSSASEQPGGFGQVTSSPSPPQFLHLRNADDKGYLIVNFKWNQDDNQHMLINLVLLPPLKLNAPIPLTPKPSLTPAAKNNLSRL